MKAASPFSFFFFFFFRKIISICFELSWTIAARYNPSCLIWGHSRYKIYMTCVNYYLYFVAVRPLVSLHPGPLQVIKGSNATLPTCHVTGHPTPVVTWSKSFGQLPQGRVQSNHSVIKLFDVRKADSADYFCTATNLLGSAVQKTLLVVVSLPRLTIRPPAKVVAFVGGSLALNCSATGDPQPDISWKRQGAQLPVGRSHQQINGALVIRDIRNEDAGNYICVAKSAGVFDVETGTYVEVQHAKGELMTVYPNTNVALISIKNIEVATNFNLRAAVRKNRAKSEFSGET